MNDYDKAGRYLVKSEPAGFFRWLVSSPDLVVQAWIDTRRVALPNQKDLTDDLVAAVVSDNVVEAICLELEAEARADAVKRLLGYMARLLDEPETSASVTVSCVSGVILDLTGTSPTEELNLRSKIVPDSELRLKVLRRSLAGEDAARILAAVAAGEISAWLLGWIPLMHGSADAAIISEWRAQVNRHLRSKRDRADLGSLVLVLATLGGCQSTWERGLRGWDMKTSPFLDEIRSESRKEGRAEGLQQGRAEEARALVLRLGRQKFQKPPSKKQQRILASITNLGQLETLAGRLLDHVDSWADLLGER
jgi:hypothetical protein